MQIRSYRPEQDGVQVYRLWQQTLQHTWPLSFATFQYMTIGNPAYRAGDHLVTEIGEEIIGFVGFQISVVQDGSSSRAGLLLLMVAPAYQRQGIGRMLHTAALVALKERKVGNVQIGGGGYCYFWPGVPINLPIAWPFFQACGWSEVERSYDLMRELDSYVTPPDIYGRIRHPDITIETATQTDISAILQFETLHFPGWLPYYQHVLEHDGYTDIVVAKEPQRGIVGTSYVMDPGAAWWQPNDFVWTQLLGERTGGIGPLGVAEDMRENGIGLALAARVTEALQARGIARSYIGYTWLVDWYGRLGYHVWREHSMSWRTL